MTTPTIVLDPFSTIWHRGGTGYPAVREHPPHTTCTGGLGENTKVSDDFDLSEWLEASELENSTPVVQALTSNEVRILNYCEQVFWESGLLPTPERLIEDLHCSRSAVNGAFSNETFRVQLAARGIDPEGLTTVGKLIQESAALSAKQIVVANMMLNLHDKRSEREKLQLCQVSSQQYHAWLRQPAFVEFLRKRGEALFQSSDFLAYKSLVSNVKAGDNKALEIFFQMRGIWNPRLTVDVNIDVVITRVLEVISKHVPAATLSLIANELDAVVEAEVS